MQGNRAHTYLGPIDHPEAIGQGDGLGPSERYPDFVAIAKGFGCGAAYIRKKADLVAALEEMIDYPGPYVLDVEVPYQEHVLPMIPGGMTVQGHDQGMRLEQTKTCVLRDIATDEVFVSFSDLPRDFAAPGRKFMPLAALQPHARDRHHLARCAGRKTFGRLAQAAPTAASARAADIRSPRQTSQSPPS